MEFKDIFSTDSSDIGKKPLLEVEIDTGVSLLITQKPYTRESWSDSEKCLTLG